MDKKNLKIALISLQKDAERVPPVGLIYIATYLKDKTGIPKENIKIIDKNFHNVEEQLQKFQPNIICISAMSVLYQKAIELATKIKQKQNIPILIGGVHISTLPPSLKKCFDVGVMSEGEATVEELIELYLNKQKFAVNDLKKIKGVIYHDKGKTKTTSMREAIDLDTLPLPDFKFAHPEYFRKDELVAIGSMGIRCFLISSRGCPYRCAFCSTARFWGKMRMHSPEYTAKIVEKQIKEHNCDYIQVLDDLFTVSPTRLKQIKEEFDKRGILGKIQGIVCNVRANLVTEELCQAMKAVKIKVVNFGFESGSERVLKYLKGESVTVEVNKKAVLLCKKYGFKVYGSLIYGSPTETIQEMKETNDFVDFCIKNKADHIWSFVSTPFPATPFWDIALEKGKVSNDMDFSLLGHHNIDNPLLLDPEIDKEEFKKVFLEGRKKLSLLKIRLIKDFVLKNPIKTFLMVVKEPQYYLGRVYKQVLKQ